MSNLTFEHDFNDDLQESALSWLVSNYAKVTRLSGALPQSTRVPLLIKQKDGIRAR